MTVYRLHSYPWYTILGTMAQRLRKLCNGLRFTELTWAWDGPTVRAFDPEAQARNQSVRADSFGYTYVFRDSAQIFRANLSRTVRCSHVNGFSSLLALAGSSSNVLGRDVHTTAHYEKLVGYAVSLYRWIRVFHPLGWLNTANWKLWNIKYPKANGFIYSDLETVLEYISKWHKIFSTMVGWKI